MKQQKTTPKPAKSQRQSAKRKPPRRPSTGVIRADEAFTLTEFCRRLGTTRFRVREMEKRGLRTATDGGRKMIRGADYIEYLGNLAAAGAEVPVQG